mmetsp:Transcript_4221/g.12438  ORF Transcript_4221/g.12438 Transcript_4221/m.12438 type:complete len:333 (+) Transcript_4221:2541-3539(+)
MKEHGSCPYKHYIPSDCHIDKNKPKSKIKNKQYKRQRESSDDDSDCSNDGLVAQVAALQKSVSQLSKKVAKKRGGKSKHKKMAAAAAPAGNSDDSSVGSFFGCNCVLQPKLNLEDILHEERKNVHLTPLLGGFGSVLKCISAAFMSNALGIMPAATVIMLVYIMGTLIHASGCQSRLATVATTICDYPRHISLLARLCVVVAIACWMLLPGTLHEYSVSAIFSDQFPMMPVGNRNVAFIRIGLSQAANEWTESSALCDLGSSVNIIQKSFVEKAIANKPCMRHPVCWYGKDTRRYKVANDKYMRAVGHIEVDMHFTKKASKPVKFLIADQEI